MAEEGKKISFGFAKSIKKPVLKSTIPQQEKKDYIECLDGKSIKIIGHEEKKDEPLVIPLLGSKTWHDRIINKIDADIFEPKLTKNEETTGVEVKQEENKLSNGNATPTNNVPVIEIKKEPVDNDANGSVSLEQQAAKEIIEDLTSTEKQTKKEQLTLPLKDSESLRGEQESTLDDYEKIPVDAFGVAMLRGMGWQPGKGIGKNEKIVSAVIPELRPKGMGLGADKATLQKQPTSTKKQEEELKIEKGSFVKIIAGKQCDNYGQIEGLDDDAGRLIIKMALGGNIVSLNEFMVQPVTKAEYAKNAKVLNAKKYEEYKDKESSKKKKSSEHSKNPKDSDNTDEEKSQEKQEVGHKNKSHRTNESKSKSRKRYSSDSDSDSSHGKKCKRRSRSSSSDSYRSKKSKKSKKHKRQDSSPERSSKKHRKKDKEREKSRDKKSRDSEYSERRKRKKHRRSRSKSRS